MSDLKQQKSLFGASIPFIFEPKITEGYLTQEQRQTARYGAKDLPGVTVAKAETAEVVAEAPKAETPASKKAESPLQNDRPGNDKPDLTRNSANNPQFDPQPQPAPQTIKPIDMAPGALSIYQRQQAQAQPQHDSTNKPSVVDQSTAFKVGLAATGSAASIERMNKRMLEETIDGHIEADNEQDAADLYIQQQMFMQSMEFRAAMVAVDRAMERQRQKIDTLRTEVEDLQRQKQESDERLETLETKIEEKEERVGQLEETVRLKEEHDKDAEEYHRASAEQEKLDQQIRELPTVKVTKGDKGTYYQTIENGEEVTYLTGPDGTTKKVTEADLQADEKAMCSKPMSTYIRKAPDGSIEYIDDYGRTLSKEDAQKLEESLKAIGKKPEDLGSMDDFEKRKQESDAHVNTQLIPAGERAEASQKKLYEATDRLGIPRQQINSLNEHLEAERKGLEELRKEYEEAKAKGQQIDNDLETKKAELAAAEAEYKEYEEFKKRLENGEFKDKKEMMDNMPESLKPVYETARADAEMQARKNETPAAAKTAAADNTSRINGSAAEPAVTASTSLGPPFSVAASGATPATPAQEPQTPSIGAEIIANTQQKTQLSGARLG